MVLVVMEEFTAGEQPVDETGVEADVARLFRGNTRRIRLFRAVEARIRAFGPVGMQVTKSQVSFGTLRKFAWVWMPLPGSRKRPADSLVLTFGLGRRIGDPRVVEAVEPRPGRWTHHVILQEETDLDGSVTDWLREAFEASGKPADRRGP